ncbi:hypothetical protein D3C74_345550 [compost metagenome]
MLTVQRLDQIILRPQPDGHLGILERFMGGDDYGLHPRFGQLGVLHQLNAAHGPHLDIRHQQINFLHADAVQRFKAAVRGINMADLQSRGSQQAAQPFANQRLIVYNQYIKHLRDHLSIVDSPTWEV